MTRVHAWVAPGSWLLLAAALPGQHAAGALFDRTAAVLERRFYDRSFRAEVLPELVARFRPAAIAAGSRDEERAVVHAFLARIPASHLALYSEATYRDLIGALDRQETPTLGMRLRQSGGRFFAVEVLPGGPAAKAGVLRGDRVAAVDGVATGASPRLDRRSDDAALDDPPVHRLAVADGDRVVLAIERRPEGRIEVPVVAAEYSAWRGSVASLRVLRHRDRRIGYLHLHYVYTAGAAKLLRTALGSTFADCDGWILDLRGRGGSALETMAILQVLRRAAAGDGPPMVALVDHTTRSGKEVIAYGIQQGGLGTLVGETTAGAVLPASFARVGGTDVLMYPARALGRYSDAIEGVGVAPDIHAVDRLPFAAGADPILQAGLAVFATAGNDAPTRKE